MGTACWLVLGRAFSADSFAGAVLLDRVLAGTSVVLVAFFREVNIVEPAVGAQIVVPLVCIAAEEAPVVVVDIYSLFQLVLVEFDILALSTLTDIAAHVLVVCTAPLVSCILGVGV